MSAAPGWLPDPTGRHEHRFWDGTRWTDDVADRGVASVDPLNAPPRPTTPQPQQPASAPAPHPRPQPQPLPQQPVPQPQAQPPGQPQPAPQHFATPPGGGGSSSGRSTALLVALGVVVLALVAGIVVVLTSQDDDEPGTDTTTSTEAPTTTTTTTVPDDTSDQVVEEFATAIHEGSDGSFTLDQARCMARGILDVIGLERLAEVRIQAGDDATVNPVDLLTEEEQEAAFDVMRACVPEGSIDPPSSG